MEIAEQTALITGGASGLGAATAKQLAASGAKVAVLDVTESTDHFSVACDVTSETAVTEALTKVIAALGVPRICVNCAGIAPAARIVGKEGPHSFDDFKRVIDINLNGTFNVMRLVAEKMMAQEALEDGMRGVIINTASVAAIEGQLGQAAYSASKGGVAAMTLPAAREFAKFGIRVMAIAPGIFLTPMMQGMPEKVQTGLHESVPFPKRMGHPEEYAALVQHIVENNYLNGTLLRLDGALRMA